MPTTRSQGAQDREIIADSNEPGQAALADGHASNVVRHRQTTSTRGLTSDANYRPRSTKPDEPPRFTIDLSLPPEQRYLEVCTAWKSEITSLTALFDEVVGGMVPLLPLKWVHLICRVLLRGIYDNEESAELTGISMTTGVSLYLLVCFNVLLDLSLGCSSGGAAIRAEGTRSKMVHFRTLDWGMPALRRILVHLEFVTGPGGPIVASCITYAGLLGVLTGVRKDLSVPLNFRPYHNDKGKFWPDAKYAWHLLLVLLGFRPSIAGTLRSYLLPKQKRTSKRFSISKPVLRAMSYQDIVHHFTGDLGEGEGESQFKTFPSSACYLCFCNGSKTTVVEKDRITAKVRSSDDFIVITKSDKSDSAWIDATTAKEESGFVASLLEILDDAKDRKQCAEHNWNNMKAARAGKAGLRKASRDERKALLDLDDVVTLVQKYPTTNESTHFACVLDPSEGSVRWCRRWVRPISSKWIREHQSETW